MLATFLINSLIVSVAVLLHYEVLRFLVVRIPELPVKPRLKVLAGLFGTLTAHVVEVWLFALGYYLLLKDGTMGALEGRNFNNSLLDCSYFSFTTYTSLGLGDIEPIGDIRFLVGLEALTGLVLITWSASFMFLEMQKFWQPDRHKI